MTSNMLQNEYQPDRVSAPGESLLEMLESLGMSQSELAKQMERPTRMINEIIQNKIAITTEIAMLLEQILHVPASFWLKREQQYREFLVRFVEEHHSTM